MADTLLCNSGSFDFRERAWELPVPISFPFDNLDLLSDMELSLYGHPSPWKSSEAGADPSDIHLYWNDRDVTEAVRHQLQARIDQADPKVLAAKLRLVFTRYLSDTGKYGFPQGADQIVATRPLSKLLTALGNSTRDSIFNFLYRDLPIQPISLGAVLQEAIPSAPTDWNQLLPAVLTISAGPCRFYSDDWKPEDHPVAGGVTYKLAYKIALTDALGRIESLVSSGGTIQTLISKTRNQLDNISARLERCDVAIGDMATLQSIRRDLAQIKANLNIV